MTQVSFPGVFLSLFCVCTVWLVGNLFCIHTGWGSPRYAALLGNKRLNLSKKKSIYYLKTHTDATAKWGSSMDRWKDQLWESEIRAPQLLELLISFIYFLDQLQLNNSGQFLESLSVSSFSYYLYNITGWEGFGWSLTLNYLNNPII